MLDAKRCKTCGEKNVADAESCASCGTPLHNRESGDDQAAFENRVGEAVLARSATVARQVVATETPEVSREETTERWRARARAAETTPRYAGFFIRAVAFSIDTTVLALFALPLALAGFAGVRAGLATLGSPPPAGSEEALESALVCGWLAMAAVYFTALNAGNGQTIGKALLGIRVRSTALSDIGTLRSLVRFVGYLVSSTFFGFGFLMAAITPSKRAWHDYLAGTCVVRLAADET